MRFYGFWRLTVCDLCRMTRELCSLLTSQTRKLVSDDPDVTCMNHYLILLFCRSRGISDRAAMQALHRPISPSSISYIPTIRM